MQVIILFLLGLAVGSFFNVVIDRSPTDESIVFGHSHCDFCHKRLRWYELIPVLSFVYQRGQCVRCHKKLSWQYPMTELCTGVLFLLLYPYGIGALLVASAFLIIFLADIKYQLIPDTAVGAIVLAGLFEIILVPSVWISHLAVAIGGGGVFWFLWALTRGRGMGFGDVKLAFALGLLLGYPLGIMAYYIAFLTGAAWGVILILGGYAKMKSKIAFGPFLIVGASISIGWGPVLAAWWNHFL